MKKLTKSELNKYISKIKNDPEYDEVAFEDENALFDFIFKKEQEFDYDLSETGQDAGMVILNVIQGNTNDIITAYEPYSVDIEDDANKGIELINTEVLNWDEWKKSHEVRRNYEDMCDAVNMVEPENADAFISMIVAGKDISMQKGQIAGCRKYEANCPVKLQDGFFPFEFRVPAGAGDSSQRRAYGVCYAKLKKLYMISLYNKNAGQEQANINFDNFMKKAKNYIQNNILRESLLYTINENSCTFEYTSFLDLYEELSKMKEDLGLNPFLEGYRAALDGQLLEASAEADFAAGYGAGQDELAARKTNALEFYKQHPELFKAAYRQYKISKEK